MSKYVKWSTGYWRDMDIRGWKNKVIYFYLATHERITPSGLLTLPLRYIEIDFEDSPGMEPLEIRRILAELIEIGKIDWDEESCQFWVKAHLKRNSCNPNYRKSAIASLDEFPNCWLTERVRNKLSPEQTPNGSGTVTEPTPNYSPHRQQHRHIHSHSQKHRQQQQQDQEHLLSLSCLKKEFFNIFNITGKKRTYFNQKGEENAELFCSIAAMCIDRSDTITSIKSYFDSIWVAQTEGTNGKLAEPDPDCPIKPVEGKFWVSDNEEGWWLLPDKFKGKPYDYAITEASERYNALRVRREEVQKWTGVD